MSGGFVWAIIYLYVYSLSCFNPKSAISREPSRVFEHLLKERQAYPSLCLPREGADFLVSFFSPLSTQWRQFSVSGVGRKFWNLIANIFKEREESNKLFKNHQVWKLSCESWEKVRQALYPVINPAIHWRFFFKKIQEFVLEGERWVHLTCPNTCNPTATHAGHPWPLGCRHTRKRPVCHAAAVCLHLNSKK